MTRDGSSGDDEPASDLARLRSDRIALVLILIAALVRTSFALEVIVHRIDVRSRVNVDAYLYDHWGARVAAGDWAMRNRYEFSGTHPDEPGAPRGSVAIAVLGLERHDAEYGPSTYFDYPGYAYFVGAVYALFGTGSRVVIVLQELIDLVACVAIYLTARRLFDRTVARTALALVALDGPLVFYAGFFLRDSMICSLGTILVYLGVRAESRRGWGLLGFALGLAWIVKGTFLLFVPFLALKLAWKKESLARLGALVLGAALAVLPCAARNVALGVPPLRMTTLEVASVILYNGPNAGTRGLYLDIPTARRVATECPKLTAASALVTAIRAHPSPIDWARQSVRRAWNVLIADDAWDNVRFGWLAPRLATMRIALVRWKLVEPFAVLGFVLALSRARRNALVLAPVLVVLGLAVIGVCLTRYRLPAEAMATILAAHALTWLVREARARRARALPAALACVAVSLVLHDSVPPPRDDQVDAYVRGQLPGAQAYLLR